MEIVLTPVEASVDVMMALESKGVIRRISPGKDTLEVARGQSRWMEIYSARERFGPHKLIAVTINSAQPKGFSYHSDPEDFLLIDREDAKGLILTVALCQHSELEAKITAGTLRAEDFMAIRCKANDPELSFFTMNGGYAHVETCTAESENPPSFYVTESRHLDENPVDFGEYRIRIGV